MRLHEFVERELDAEVGDGFLEFILNFVPEDVVRVVDQCYRNKNAITLGKRFKAFTVIKDQITKENINRFLGTNINDREFENYEDQLKRHFANALGVESLKGI